MGFGDQGAHLPPHRGETGPVMSVQESLGAREVMTATKPNILLCTQMGSPEPEVLRSWGFSVEPEGPQ